MDKVRDHKLTGIAAGREGKGEQAFFFFFFGLVFIIMYNWSPGIRI